MLVIYWEIGMLFYSIFLDFDKEKDVDLILLMLVVINDFVVDVFGVISIELENEFGEIKMEDFMLLIKIGL